MAKSLRSKWRRKCRAVKRVRYGQKELERLKKTLGIDDSKPADTIMEEVTEIATVKDKNSMTVKEIQEQNEAAEAMDDGTVKRIYNPRTMRDQFGNYPVWMNKRKIKKHQNKDKKVKKAKNKQKRKLK